MAETGKIEVALIGNPNSGKSTLFNALTGLNQKTGNFPGTTVDRKTGVLKLNDNTPALLQDLPGTYSLYPKSADERVTVETLLSSDRPDKVVVVADASNLKRSLLLCTEVMDLGFPLVLALNMIDLAEKKHIINDAKKLSKELGISVVEVNARKRTGIDELKKAILECKPEENEFYKINPAIIQFLEELSPVLQKERNYEALIWAHNISQTTHEKQNISKILEKYEFNSNTLQQRETLERFKKIDDILSRVSVRRYNPEAEEWSTRVDKVLTHKWWGFLIFFGILFTVFQSIFNLAQIPMDFIEDVFGQLSTYVHKSLPDTWWNNLICDGVIAGLSGVISFIPQIIILFAFITLLEDSGYMARVSFIMDQMMRKFGLNGKSIVPLMGGMACAVPSIMSTRSIENVRDRLITIMVTPLMSCSARLPVYTLLIALITPEKYILGFINLQGLLLFVMYITGFFSAIFVALIFKLILKKVAGTYFIMELPVYKFPTWRNLRQNVYNRAKTFVTEAGGIIIAVSVILWFLGSYGPGKSLEEIEKKYQTGVYKSEEEKGKAELQMKAEKLEASYAGRFGHFIEPVIKPLGFDWKIGIALISSFAAREVFVGTMSTIYNIEDPEDTGSIRERMRKEKDPVTGLPRYRPVVALSLMFFYAFALQCTSTIAVVYKETKGWKWPGIQLIVMTAMAWCSSFIIYQLFK